MGDVEMKWKIQWITWALEQWMKDTWMDLYTVYECVEQTCRYVLVHNNCAFAETAMSLWVLPYEDTTSSLFMLTRTLTWWTSHSCPDPAMDTGLLCWMILCLLGAGESKNIKISVCYLSSDYVNHFYFLRLFSPQNSQKVELPSLPDIRSQKKVRPWLCGAIPFLATKPFTGTSRPQDRAWGCWFTLRMKMQ